MGLAFLGGQAGARGPSRPAPTETPQPSCPRQCHPGPECSVPCAFRPGLSQPGPPRESSPFGYKVPQAPRLAMGTFTTPGAYPSHPWGGAAALLPPPPPKSPSPSWFSILRELAQVSTPQSLLYPLRLRAGLTRASRPPALELPPCPASVAQGPCSPLQHPWVTQSSFCCHLGSSCFYRPSRRTLPTTAGQPHEGEGLEPSPPPEIAGESASRRCGPRAGLMTWWGWS